MLSPDLVLSVATFAVGVAAAVVWVVTREQPPRPGPRRAALPPADGARSAGPGAVSSLADVPRIEPPITPSSLVRPFVTHPAPVPAPVPGTWPTDLRGGEAR